MELLEGKDGVKEIGKGREMVEEKRWWRTFCSGVTFNECQEKFSRRVERWLSSFVLFSPKVDGRIYFSKT